MSLALYETDYTSVQRCENTQFPLISALWPHLAALHDFTAATGRLVHLTETLVGCSNLRDFSLASLDNTTLRSIHASLFKRAVSAETFPRFFLPLRSLEVSDLNDWSEIEVLSGILDTLPALQRYEQTYIKTYRLKRDVHSFTFVHLADNTKRCPDSFLVALLAALPSSLRDVRLLVEPATKSPSWNSLLAEVGLPIFPVYLSYRLQLVGISALSQVGKHGHTWTCPERRRLPPVHVDRKGGKRSIIVLAQYDASPSESVSESALVGHHLSCYGPARRRAIPRNSRGRRRAFKHRRHCTCGKDQGQCGLHPVRNIFDSCEQALLSKSC